MRVLKCLPVMLMCIIAFMISSNTVSHAEATFDATYDAEGKQLLVTGAADEILVAVVKPNSKNVVTLSSVKWDIYTDVSSETVIPMNCVNEANDTYIAVKTLIADDASYSEPIVLKVRKNKTKYVGTVDVSADGVAYWNIRAKSKKGEIVLSGDAIPEVDQIYGTTYRKKVPGEQASGDAGVITFGSDEITVKDGGQSYSKYLKIKVAKRANPPAAKINYVKETNQLSIPKGCEYRIITADNAANAADVKYTLNSVKGFKLTLPLASGDSSGVIEVRKPAKSAEAGGKVASKVRLLEYMIADAPTSSEITASGSNKGKSKCIVTINNPNKIPCQYYNGKKWVALGKKVTINVGDSLIVRKKGNAATYSLPSEGVIIYEATEASSDASKDA